MKHTTLCNKYGKWGLKNLDIFPEIASLQCSWVKRLYDASFHAWEVIPLFLIKNNLGKKFELTRRVTLNTNFRIFRYKLLHNILYLNEMLHKFGKKVIPTLLFLHGRAWKPRSSFSFLYKNKLSLDAVTAFFPKYTKNFSSYTTERHQRI